LLLAVEHGAAIVSFPQISTGAYGYPMRRAAAIAVREVRAFLADGGPVGQVRLVAFSARAREALDEALGEA
jgi:O-acetyl-ADP-ribose deacetylase (regulator of RNase III)